MRFRIILSLLLCGIFMPNYLSAQGAEVLGEIVGSAEQDIYIQFPLGANPESNKVLNVVWIPDDTRIDVGKVKVVSSEDGFATATLLEGQASIGMKVVFHAPSPARGASTRESSQAANRTVATPARPAALPPSVAEDADDEIGEALDIDTSWAYSMVNAEQWEDQSLLAKSSAVSRYSRALAASMGKSEKSQSNSLRLFLKSAKAGYRLSQYRVAWMLENGLGTDKNLTLALAWYQIAAARGHKKAALGMARLEGQQQ